MAETSGGPVRVLLVTSDREACGIRQYGWDLMNAVPKEQAQIAEFAHPHPPEELFKAIAESQAAGAWMPEVIHLNHHAALHSGWGAAEIAKLKDMGFGVVVTQHDTFEDVKIMESRGFQDFADADYLFTHERVEGLAEAAAGRAKVMVVPMGVPEIDPKMLHKRNSPPVLGLFGFDFPWKGFDLAVSAAKVAGWRVKLLSPNLTVERAEALHGIHPDGLEISAGWQSQEKVLEELAGCDATAFLYANGNSGMSGAVRMGIAVQHPVLALQRACRQFRDLERDERGLDALDWVTGTIQGVSARLKFLAANYLYWQTKQKAVTQLAQRDSWRNVGIAYGGCYLELGARLRAVVQV